MPLVRLKAVPQAIPEVMVGGELLARTGILLLTDV